MKNFDNLQVIISKYLDNDECDLIHKAYLFAAAAHDGQLRKSGEPYIIHPVSVAIILAEQKLTSDIIIAGLLHDVIEDTEVTNNELGEFFGNDIVNIVDGVTKLGNIKGLDNEQVLAENHRKIIIATAKDIRVILVKLADRLHNMMTINYMNESKQKIIAKETLEVYAPIAHRLGMYKIKWELEDLSFRCLNRKAYDEIAHKINMRRAERDEYVEILLKEIEELMNDNSFHPIIYGRTKHIYSIYSSMKKRNKTFDEITDLFGFRIIVNTINECYQTLGLIHENYKPIPLRFKDYIPTPKHNLYQSIHTTVLTNQGIPVEFQIRTKEMDKVAENGVAAHWNYKEGIDSKERQSKVNELIVWLQRAAKDLGDSSSSDFMKNIQDDYLSKSLIVYTPKGDVVEIPQKSTLLDFAFNIHTDIGIKAVGGKVNDCVVSLFYPLEMGDVVQVVTSDVAEPDISYLSKVNTSRARDALKRYFKEIEKKKLEQIGHKLLMEKAKNLNIEAIQDKFNDNNMLKIVLNFDVSSIEDFYIRIATGDIKLYQVMKFLENNSIEVNNNEIEINGFETPIFRLCTLCKPIPGDKIVAIKNNNPNLDAFVIHQHSCSHTNVDELYDCVFLDTQNTYEVNVDLKLKDKPNVLYNVIKYLERFNVNISSILMRKSTNNISVGKITLEVKDIEELNNIIDALQECKNIIFIQREEHENY